MDKLCKGVYNPGITTYGLGPSILRSHYTSYLPRGWFLNEDAYLTTWGCFDGRDFMHREAVFIRPDSGYKVFTGQTVEYKDLKERKQEIEQQSEVRPETLIWVSSVKNIENEYRVWISNGKVVTWSEYSWDKTELEPAGIPKNMLIFAKGIANYRWQVDRIYVVDLTTIDGIGPYVVEFNSFSCSGLYDCDSEKLFETVSRDILAEWAEE